MLKYLINGVLFLLTPLYLIYKPPDFLIRYCERRWPDVLFRTTTTSKVVALTIDDCPSEHTAEILAILDANNAHATFFVIGSQVAGREHTLQSLVCSGHELGNHAMHDEPSRRLSAAELVAQIRSVEATLDEAYLNNHVPVPPRYFRPGSGFFNSTVRSVTEALGYRIVLGNIYPHDPVVPFSRVNKEHILSMLRSGGIIICHDRRAWTVPMLREVLPEVRRRGYSVVTITDLLRTQGT